MKKEYYTMLTVLLMIIALAMPWLHGKDATHNLSKNGNAVATSLSEDEIYAKLWKEFERLEFVTIALGRDYEHSLLVKYDALNFTEEERLQRIKELGGDAAWARQMILGNREKNAEERRNAKELDDLYWALMNAASEARALSLSSLRGGGREWLVIPDTEEYRECERTERELSRIVRERKIALVDVRDGEIRIAPDTEEYRELRQEFERLAGQPELAGEESAKMKLIVGEINQMAKTNTPTSVFQISSGFEERRREREKKELESEKRGWERLLQEREQEGADEQNIQHLRAIIKRLEASLDTLSSQ